MATVNYSLSKKVREGLGDCEVLIRFSGSRNQVFRAKSEIFVMPQDWDSVKGKVKIPRLRSQRTKELVDVQNRLDELANTIISSFASENTCNINKEWLKDVIHVFQQGESEEEVLTVVEEEKHEQESDLFVLLRRYLLQVKESRSKHGASMLRMLQRYEMYARIPLTLDGLKESDLCGFEEFLKIEHTFFDENRNPVVHKSIYKKYPRHRACQKRGPNGIFKIMALFRSFYHWAVKGSYTSNNPFKNHKMAEPPYGTPYYLTKEELDRVFAFDLSSRPALERQRDIFVLQSLLACRVSDYYQLTYDNIVNGCIEYIADKKKDKTVATIRVPLTNRAQELIKRYEDHERKTIMPFISQQKYNDSIKLVLKTVGIDRVVTTINKTTREEEKHPIWEVASSHMARRNFIGIMYQKVQDPNIIGSMSGHAYGSKAFARYRTVNDDLKKNALSALE